MPRSEGTLTWGNLSGNLKVSHFGLSDVIEFHGLLSRASRGTLRTCRDQRGEPIKTWREFRLTAVEYIEEFARVRDDGLPEFLELALGSNAKLWALELEALMRDVLSCFGCHGPDRIIERSRLRHGLFELRRRVNTLELAIETASDRLTNGAAGELERERPSLSDEPKLTRRQITILGALKKLRALNQDCRCQTKRILELVDPQGSAGSLKNPLAELKRLGYICSLGSGRDGGYWLTQAGHERFKRAEQLQPSRKRSLR